MLLVTLGILAVLLGVVLIGWGIVSQRQEQIPSPSPEARPVPPRAPTPTSTVTNRFSPSVLPREYVPYPRVAVRVGETGEGPDQMSVEFFEVEKDGRCPSGRECYWAGEATIRVRIWPPLPPGRIARRDPPEPVTLTMMGMRSYVPPLEKPKNSVTLSSSDSEKTWVVVFYALNPYPVWHEDPARRYPEKSSYVASFVFLPPDIATALTGKVLTEP